MSHMQHDLADRLLKNRGIVLDEDRSIFLNPTYATHDPFLMKDMDRALVRFYTAIKQNEHIVVYSDYDADGIPGAVILSDLFKKIGYTNISNYIPDRHSDGYGLSVSAIDEAKEKNASLIITIDLGITGVQEVIRAKELGIDVIITDHHLPHDIVPPAYAILNPKQKECEYPYKELCGAGVIFKFVQGFIQKYGTEFSIPIGFEKWSLDMVALATLSDMVPLTGENRIFAKFGLTVFQKTRRKGLLSLLRKLKINPRYLTEDDIAFMVTPRLNAASRMDNPRIAFDILSTDSDDEALEKVTQLEKINTNRKTMVATIMKDVYKRISTDKHILVIGNPLWRPGILGLVATKITETYKKPAFVWGGNDDPLILKGSCRSDGSVHLVSLMERSGRVLSSFGGHVLAGGFSLTRESIHLLEEVLNEEYELLVKEDTAGKKEKIITHDGVLSFSDLHKETKELFSVLAPFGIGNPKPLFVFENIIPISIRMFGKTKEHLEIVCVENYKEMRAIGFFTDRASFKKDLKEGEAFTLIASFEKSYFLGKEEERLRIVDIL